MLSVGTKNEIKKKIFLTFSFAGAMWTGHLHILQISEILSFFKSLALIWCCGLGLGFFLGKQAKYAAKYNLIITVLPDRSQYKLAELQTKKKKKEKISIELCYLYVL